MSQEDQSHKKPPQRIRHKKERAHKAEKAKARKRAKAEQKKKKSRQKQGRVFPHMRPS